MYRTESPDAEVLRLRAELEATKKERDSKAQRLRLLTTLIVGAIPPALVIRYHAPSRVLLLDVLVFAVWGWLIVRASRRDPR